MKYIHNKIMWKEFVAGVVLASLILTPWSSLFNSDPYKDVEVTNVEVTDELILITANFTKTECAFKRLEVFGTDFGETYNLAWQNQPSPDEVDNGKEHDRVKGQQTLKIQVTTQKRAFDTIEIRTRHDCNGTIADKTFALIDMENGTRGKG